LIARAEIRLQNQGGLLLKNNGFERLGLTLGKSGIEQTMHDVPWLFRAGFGDRGSIRPIPV
jgi:hypothetical protein